MHTFIVEMSWCILHFHCYHWYMLEYNHCIPFILCRGFGPLKTTMDVIVTAKVNVIFRAAPSSCGLHWICNVEIANLDE